MELVIFDCDGVLVNSEAIYIAAEMDFLESAGLSYTRRDYVKTYTGMQPNAWRLKLAAEAQKRQCKPLEEGFFEALDQYVMGRFEAHLTAISGVRESVSSLELKRCVASSSSIERLHWKLGHTGLSDLFMGAVFSSDMVTKGKPEPDLFLHAASIMDVKPEECIVIEDSYNGVLAGKAANMTVIGFYGGDHCLEGHDADLMEAGADQVVDDFANLKLTIDQFS